MIIAAVSLLAMSLALEVAYQADYVPSPTGPWHVLLPIVGLVLGGLGLYGRIRYDLNDVTSGVVVGVSVFVVAASPLYLLSLAGYVGDDGVLAGVFLSLFTLATLHSVLNEGLLTCCSIVAVPVFGVLGYFFYVHGGSFGQVSTMTEAIVQAGTIAVAVGAVGGTAAFVGGLVVRRIYLRST